MSESLKYIELLIRMHDEREQYSAYHYVRDRGRLWEQRIYPRDVRQGTPRQCYMNAAHLATRCAEYTYVEGVAMAIIPVDHAWCVDRAGRVIDPTWEPGSGKDYFGVKIPRGRLNKILLTTEVYGVFPHWFDPEVLKLLPGALQGAKIRAQRGHIEQAGR